MIPSRVENLGRLACLLRLIFPGPKPSIPTTQEFITCNQVEHWQDEQTLNTCRTPTPLPLATPGLPNTEHPSLSFDPSSRHGQSRRHIVPNKARRDLANLNCVSDLAVDGCAELDPNIAAGILGLGENKRMGDCKEPGLGARGIDQEQLHQCQIAGPATSNMQTR